MKPLQQQVSNPNGNRLPSDAKYIFGQQRKTNKQMYNYQMRLEINWS